MLKNSTCSSLSLLIKSPSNRFGRVSLFKLFNNNNNHLNNNKFIIHNNQQAIRGIMKIYTKTGDKGTTSLYSGERRTKDDLVFDALGSVDELNAHLGLAYEHLLHIKLCDELGETDMNNIELLKSNLTSIQSRLLDLGSCIATPIETTNSEEKINRVKFDSSNIEKVENWIDTLDGSLPPLKNFILPGGGLTASQLHVARTVCRRSERDVVSLVNRGQQGLEDVQKYLNRLSDFLFVAARYASKIEGKEEVVYKK